MPKRAAALHEAGHAVLYVVEGERVKSVRIKSRRIGGTLAWGGQTFGGRPWRVNPSTDPAADLRQARLKLAGVAAEMVFDADDFREGSSLDEVLLGRRICAIAAAKMGRDADALYEAVLVRTRVHLRENGDVVLRLAAGLERHGWLRGQALQDMLAPVRRAGT